MPTLVGPAASFSIVLNRHRVRAGCGRIRVIESLPRKGRSGWKACESLDSIVAKWRVPYDFGTGNVNHESMAALRVALVSRERSVRLAAATAFDAAPADWQVTLHDEAPEDAGAVVVYGRDVESGNGISFDPSHPERMLSELHALEGPRAARKIAVTGAGRGTGVTTVALHLCKRLAAAGSTCFVDLDAGCGARERLGLGDEQVRTWAEAGPDEDALRLSALPLQGGFRALLSPDDGRDPDDAPELVQRTARAFERVVVDVPHGELLEDTLTVCDVAVLIVPPTPTGAHRARACLERFPDARWAIVANRAGPGGETTRSALARMLGRPVTIELPCWAALRDAEDEGRLLGARLSRWSYRLELLARTLERA